MIRIPLVSLFLLAASNHVAAQSATFDSANPGFASVTLPFPNPGAPPVEVGSPNSVQWLASGGNPGGRLHAIDPDGSTPGGQTQYWRAPASWLGDRSELLGGRVRFDVRSVSTFSAFSQEDVLLTGNGATIVYFGNVLVPSNAWNTIDVPLAAGSWRVGNRNGPLATTVQIQNVLAALGSVYLRAEFHNGPDTHDLDNLAFHPPAATQIVGAGCGGGAMPAPSVAVTSAPVLGGTYGLQCTAPGAALGIVIHGLTAIDPGVDLTGLGLTGCTLYETLDVIVGEPFVSGVLLHSLSIPNDLSWSGLRFRSQCGVLAPVNPFGMVLSPAVEVRVGT